MMPGCCTKHLLSSQAQQLSHVSTESKKEIIANFSNKKLPTLLQLSTLYLPNVRSHQRSSKCCSVGWKIIPWKLFTYISISHLAALFLQLRDVLWHVACKRVFVILGVCNAPYEAELSRTPLTYCIAPDIIMCVSYNHVYTISVTLFNLLQINIQHVGYITMPFAKIMCQHPVIIFMLLCTNA